mmetsp:Transcript_53709/g.143656  ORF Transcript_53709/g.143656 Transcript_53709/m.143656 type:complete len:202 (+) Transcript_53709:3021-3626(+)
MPGPSLIEKVEPAARVLSGIRQGPRRMLERSSADWADWIRERPCARKAQDMSADAPSILCQRHRTCVQRREAHRTLGKALPGKDDRSPPTVPHRDPLTHQLLSKLFVICLHGDLQHSGPCHCVLDEKCAALEEHQCHVVPSQLQSRFHERAAIRQSRADGEFAALSQHHAAQFFGVAARRDRHVHEGTEDGRLETCVSLQT